MPYTDAFTLSDWGRANLSENNIEKWGDPMVAEITHGNYISSNMVDPLTQEKRKFLKFGNLPRIYNLQETKFCENKELGYLWQCIFWSSDKHKNGLE